MEDHTIKLLYINSKVHALISINQAPAGETGIGVVTQPIAANASFLIGMLPLENDQNFVYLPYTRRVSIAGGGAISHNDGLIDLCSWPENIIELTLYPQSVYKSVAQEIAPTVLSPFDFFIGGERHTAFIYNEAYSSFAVEHAAGSKLKFISPLPFFVQSAEISFVKLGEMPVLYAAGKTEKDERFLYVAYILPLLRTAVCTLCESSRIEGDGISVVTNGEYRQEKTRYAPDSGRLLPAHREFGWFTRQEKPPETTRDICTSLLQAVQANLKDEAMRCLTASLADGLSFEDLKEFFGDYLVWTPSISPACGPDSFALKYSTQKGLYTAREFCVETKTVQDALRIDNIREP